tara:strand:+ start:1136 stop:1831 length:696 start_codon:yes stop_codon:yes gene_type:complete
MGYLSKDEITVDAVLTKKGRQMISLGNQLNITAFTLSDTGVDYTLWNPDHPSGSAFYGEAIENLPMTEALVHSQYAYRNKLITLPRDTVQMPTLESSQDPTQTWLFPTPTAAPITFNVVGFNGGGRTGGGMHLLIQDSNVITSTTGTVLDITGNALSFIYEQDVPQAVLYELPGSGPNFTFQIQPQTIRDTAGATTNITAIDALTGAYVTIAVKVNHNEDVRPRKSQGIQG